MQCIYCKEIITEANDSQEHVFPAAFGCPDTWVLDCVCRKCNNDLGGSIDRFLASDSIEGLWRLQKFGSKSKKPTRQLRLKLKIPEEERYGRFKGLIVYTDFSKRDSINLPPQVSYDHDGKRRSVLLEEINNDKIIREIKSHEDNLGVFGNDEGEMQNAYQILNERGINPRVTGQSGLPQSAIDPDNKLEIIASSVMDDFIFRAIAKISFNYLAKVHGDQYALNSKFDNIRNYIRNGQKTPKDIVQIKNGHILGDETDKQYYFEGHLFTIKVENNEIISQIALTNMFNFKYEVKLGNLGPIWQNLQKGHGYSVKFDKIVEMSSYSPTFLAMKGFIVPRGSLNKN